MAQLSHDQFWGVLVEKWKFTFENNFQVKQHNFHSSCPIIVNENFVWGPFGEDWGGPPGLSLELPVVGRNCAYVARGIYAPPATFTYYCLAAPTAKHNPKTTPKTAAAFPERTVRIRVG